MIPCVSSLFVPLLLCSLPLAALDPLQSPPAPERSPFDTAAWGIVYDVPATAQVKLEKNVPFHRSGERELQLDIYLPPDAKAPVPVVVFANGIGDRPTDRVKEWGIYSSWPRLVAAHGLAGVSMDCDGEHIPESLAAVFAFLEREGAKHGIDGTHVGVYAASANVSATSRFLLRPEAPKSVLAAVFYYGTPEVASARRDLPVLCVTAESDLVRLREPLGALWTQTLATGAPWTFELATDLPHAFDALADNDASRRTIQRTIAFWKSQLEPVPQPKAAPSPVRAILAAMFGNDDAALVRLLGEWITAHPDQREAYAMRGLALARQRRGREAKPDLEKALALGSDDPGVHGTLGMLLAGEGKDAQAVEHMRRAVAANWFGSELYGYLGHSELVLGQNEAAVASYEAALRIGIPPGPNTLGLAHYNLACGYARLGRSSEALASIERAVEQGFGTRRDYESDQDFVPLRAEERFLVALERLTR